MPVKREPCKFFQRGSCQYGNKCKFLHVAQQQPKSNIFGFGSQSGSDNHQKSNPYGFGVQNNSQSKGAAQIGSQHKPFENKWTRFSTPTATSAPSSQKSDKQPHAANHECRDTESCTSIIIEDFKHERPLWKLTCYGHWKNLDCDVHGDVSYEELRAAAYDDAKRGLNLQSIVERERNLLNTKLIEFENICKPWEVPSNSTFSRQNPIPSASPNAFLQTAQNNAAPSVSSFSQLATSLNTGFGPRQPAPSNNGFVQQDIFANFTQSSRGFGANNSPSGSGGSLGNQFPAPAQENVFPPNTRLGNIGAVRPEANTFSTSALSAQIPGAATSQSEVEFVTNVQRETVFGETSIWVKKKWISGEIPEEPPDAVVDL